MPTQTIASGDTERIVDARDADQPYIVRVPRRGGDVRIGHSSRQGRPTAGTLIEAGHSARINQDESERDIYAAAVGGDVDLEINPADVDVQLLPPIFLRAQQLNREGLVSDSISPGASWTAFGDQDVPDGFSVLVQNTDASDTVTVGPTGGPGIDLEPGNSIGLAVQNLNQIFVLGTANNPTVVALVEEP